MPSPGTAPDASPPGPPSGPAERRRPRAAHPLLGPASLEPLHDLRPLPSGLEALRQEGMPCPAPGAHGADAVLAVIYSQAMRESRAAAGAGEGAKTCDAVSRGNGSPGTEGSRGGQAPRSARGGTGGGCRAGPPGPAGPGLPAGRLTCAREEPRAVPATGLVRYLALPEGLDLHRRVMEQGGGSQLVRDLGALTSAVAQPRMAPMIA